MTKKFAVKNGPYANYQISGDDLPSAIESSFKTILKEISFGSAAGCQLSRVTAAYDKGIFGGIGGVELLITAQGLPIVGDDELMNPVTKGVWIHASEEDLPAPREFDIANLS